MATMYEVMARARWQVGENIIRLQTGENKEIFNALFDDSEGKNFHYHIRNNWGNTELRLAFGEDGMFEISDNIDPDIENCEEVYSVESKVDDVFRAFEHTVLAVEKKFKTCNKTDEFEE